MYILVSFLVFGAGPVWGADSPSIQKQHLGLATDSKNKILYQEEKNISLVGSQPQTSQISFKNLSGETFATASVDFTKNAKLPDLFFLDSRFGYKIVQKSLDQKRIQVSVQENSKAPLKEKILKVPQQALSEHGMDFFIKENFNDILQKGSIDFNFLIPLKLKFYKFKLSVDSKTNSTVTFKIDIKNWLLRFFAPQIKATYSLEQKELLKFEGPTQILTEQEKSQNLRISYQERVLASP